MISTSRHLDSQYYIYIYVLVAKKYIFCFWNVVSISTYHIPFWHHMTLHMTCFVNLLILDRLVSGVLGPADVAKTNYVVIGVKTLML